MKYLSTTFTNYIYENTNESTKIKDIIINRIPFLKDYNIFKNRRNEDRLDAQLVKYNEDVTMMSGDSILLFPQFNVSSEITYYSNKIGDNIFHNFIIKNSFHVIKPEELDDLTFRVFNFALRQLENNLSYNNELMLPADVDIPKDEFDKIINEMNRILFKIEEFTEKHYLNLY